MRYCDIIDNNIEYCSDVPILPILYAGQNNVFREVFNNILLILFIFYILKPKFKFLSISYEHFVSPLCMSVSYHIVYIIYYYSYDC